MKMWVYSALAYASVCVMVSVLPGAAQDNVYYRSFKLKPTQRGKLKTKFYYNSVEFPDILSSIVTLSFNEYIYVFNQTNDISDMFYWRRASKPNGIYKYDRWIDKGGRVKMLINARRQWATIDMKGVNLLGLSTNRTGVHTVGLQISEMQKSERIKLVNYTHAGRMGYETNFFYVRSLFMRYGRGPADTLTMRFIAKHNEPESLPASLPAVFVVDGAGGVSSFSGLTFNVALAGKGKGTFAGKQGPVRAVVNFKSGQGMLTYSKQALPITLAPSQSNMIFTVRAAFGGAFDEQSSFRAGYVHANTIKY